MRRLLVILFVLASVGCYGGSGGPTDTAKDTSGGDVGMHDASTADGGDGGPCGVEACGSGQRCVGGECTQYPCYEGSCPSGYICDEEESGGVCLKDEDECTIDSDCPDGAYCQNFECKAREADAGMSDGSS